jgi:hypothetical protein
LHLLGEHAGKLPKRVAYLPQHPVSSHTLPLCVRDMVAMGLPCARQQQVDVEEVGHGKSAMMAFTDSVVIGGASAGATRTFPPLRFSTSRALEGAARRMTRRSPSREMAT